MNYIATRCLLAAIFLASNLATAQPKQGQAYIDSLVAELPKMKEDTNAVNLINSITYEYNNINPNEGLKWAEKELTLAQKIGWQQGEGMAYNDLGNNYQNKGAYPAALDAFLKALRIAEALENKVFISVLYGNIGSVYYRQKDYPKALEWNNKAMKIGEEEGDSITIAITSSNVASIYSDQGKDKEAMEYRLRALRIAEAGNGQRTIIIQSANISLYYAKIKQFNMALIYSFKALRMAEQTGNKQNVAINLGNIGTHYYCIAKDSTAPKPDSLVLASRAANLAKSIDYLNRSIAACRESQMYEGLMEFSRGLSNALALQGDYQGALAAYRQSVDLKDSLFNTTNNETIANLETKRAVELKNKDIQIVKLKKRNERVLFISGFAVLLLIMGLMFRNYRKQQRSNKLLSKEKKRSDDLLLNILPAEVAEELKNTGGADAKQYDEVSVLFTDFVNFTSTAEHLSPQTLVKELHECFTAFDAIIELNGLEKIKTIGDAYMAVCGLPVSDPRHAQRTVQAALEITDFVAARAKQAQVFRVRIGIHSGPVVAGIVGVKKFAYDIWGDTVNTAARMESASEPGRVNISQATYDLVKDHYHCDYRGQVTAKNKGEVAMYFVEATIASPAYA